MDLGLNFQKNAQSKYKNSLCVAVNNKKSRFEFYSMENGDNSTVSREKVEYTAALYSDDFMAELTDAVKNYAENHPSSKESSVTLLLPDSAVAMDTVNIPNINRKRNEDAIDAAITGIFKNRSELTVNRYLAAQNKQMVTYSLSIINDKIKNAFLTAFTNAELPLNAITFCSNGITNAACQLVPKIKSSSCLLVDIKSNESHFVFVAKGRTSGSYTLPFGYSILEKNKVFPEELLIEHPVAELAVLNAREKARAKQLTMMSADTDEDSETESETDSLDAMFGGDENATADPTANTVQTIKVLPKKQPRKLPKFMERPIPKNDREFGYENFRLFVKWALNLIASNDKLTMQGEPESVFVNMPSGLDYLFDMVNAEKDENGIEFLPLDLSGNSKEVTDYLELFGGLYALQYNKQNNFI